MNRPTIALREQLAVSIAANLPARRSGSEGGKELGYGG